MATSYGNTSLGHLTNHLIYLSTASSFWFSLNSSYEHDFHLLLELTSSEPLTLDEEVRMQEEWHHDERKCIFILLACDLLLLNLDMGNNDQPCVDVASPLHILLPLRCCCTADCRCPCAVHCRRRRRIAVAPSITIAVTSFIACCHCAVRRCHAAATTMPPPSCHRRRTVALPPPPRRRQAIANVALSRCRHRRSRRAAATALPLSRCAQPLTLPPPRCRQAAPNVVLSRCCHRCSRRRRDAVHWLVVVLLSAVQFRHCMPSCDRQCSYCWPLLPIIVFHRRHRRCHWAATATAATATTMVELTVEH
jgi:hypothetical protein